MSEINNSLTQISGKVSSTDKLKGFSSHLYIILKISEIKTNDLKRKHIPGIYYHYSPTDHILLSRPSFYCSRSDILNSNKRNTGPGEKDLEQLLQQGVHELRGNIKFNIIFI